VINAKRGDIAVLRRVALAFKIHNQLPFARYILRSAIKTPQCGLNSTVPLSHSVPRLSAGVASERGVRIMPNANYYRAQASLLAKWSLSARDRDVSERLMRRAQELAVLAERSDLSGESSANAVDVAAKV
jgi:hypothetical protein